VTNSNAPNALLRGYVLSQGHQKAADALMERVHRRITTIGSDKRHPFFFDSRRSKVPIARTRSLIFHRLYVDDIFNAELMEGFFLLYFLYNTQECTCVALYETYLRFLFFITQCNWHVSLFLKR